MWFLTWLAAATGTHYPRRKLSSLQNFIYRLTTLAATFLLFTITPWPGLDVQYRFWERALDERLSWLLVGIAFAGFCLAWWSTVHQIAVRRRQREVVDNGPFGIVRQPIYVGLIIAAFATAVMFGRPSSLTGALLFTIAFIVKILIEEQVLREESYAHDEYIGRVPMLVPFFPTRDRPVRHAKSDRVEPTLLRASRVEPAAARAEERVSVVEPADESDEELFSEPVAAPVAAPVDQPEKPAVTIQNKKLGSDPGLSPVTAKAVQLTLLLGDPDTSAEAPVLSDATTKD
jgi:protein-S-isoprenylcysteine O-methyltransferase Ste14